MVTNKIQNLQPCWLPLQYLDLYGSLQSLKYMQTEHSLCAHARVRLSTWYEAPQTVLPCHAQA